MKRVVPRRVGAGHGIEQIAACKLAPRAPANAGLTLRDPARTVHSHSGGHALQNDHQGLLRGIEGRRQVPQGRPRGLSPSHRCHPDQRGDMAEIEPPQLWLFGDQAGTGHRANVACGLQQPIQFAEVLADMADHLRVDVIELGLQGGGRLGCRRAGVICRRWRSDSSMAINCRRRVTKAASHCWRWSVSGRRKRSKSWCRTSMLASMTSVLARCPMALTKSRAWCGLITATGKPAACRAQAALPRSRQWLPSSQGPHPAAAGPPPDSTMLA